MSDGPRAPISVVVPTKDRPGLLDACLRSLRAVLDAGDELIVADSASTGPETRAIAEACGATYVRCERHGASAARNEGWRRAHHAIIAFVDDDVLVEAGWADAIARAFDAHADTAFLTGRVGLKEEQATTERPVALLDRTESALLDAAARGTLGHSANLAIRRSALERIGGFDECMGAGATLYAAEDQDLFDRSFAAGLTGRYEPSMSAVHEQWRSRRDMLGLEWRYGVGLGARVAKLFRSDRARARRVARELFWDAGVRRAALTARQRYEFGVLYSLLHAFGGLIGLLRGLMLPVRNGHFARRGGR